MTAKTLMIIIDEKVAASEPDDMDIKRNFHLPPGADEDNPDPLRLALFILSKKGLACWPSRPDPDRLGGLIVMDGRRRGRLRSRAGAGVCPSSW